MRLLGRSGIDVGAVGIGTWAMGGPFAAGDDELGWGEVDDEVSIRALQRAVDLGATLVDTADVYGAGHAERVIARALGHRRDDVVYATKWGNTYDEARRQWTGTDASTAWARRALHASLARLSTDRIDIWQLHLSDLEPGPVEDLIACCEDLVDEGLIRTYGWSTDDPVRATGFAGGKRCGVVQFGANVVDPSPKMVTTARVHDLGCLVRSPLAMGLLSDRMTNETVIGEGDVRRTGPAWLRWFVDGRPSPDYLARREAVREILTSDGRTVAEGALAWLWALDERIVPIPGCRTVAQVEENVGAMAFGPLRPAQVTEIDNLLSVERL